MDQLVLSTDLPRAKQRRSYPGVECPRWEPWSRSHWWPRRFSCSALWLRCWSWWSATGRAARRS